jgi:hypothetical protein
MGKKGNITPQKLHGNNSNNTKVDEISDKELKKMIIRMITRDGGVAQVIDCLLIKHEALSSNPSTVKKFLKRVQK